MTTTEHRPSEAPSRSSEVVRRRTTSRARPIRRVLGTASGVVAYYLGLGAVTTLLALGFLGMYTRPLGVPLVYSGDALSGGSQFKGTIETGWYEHNPHLAAPFGQNLHDFPTADNLQYVFARVFGIFTDQWAVAYNLTYLLTYPLTAIAAAWFLRRLGANRTIAFAFGILYAFTPYHFIHGQPHLSLSMLFAVPLFSALILAALADQPLWGHRGPTGARWREGRRWRIPLSWVTWRSAGTIAILAVTGTTSSYYAVFGLLLMSVAVLVLLLRRRIRRALGAVMAMAGLVFFMVVNMAPDALYERSVPPSPAAFDRQPLESEIYALKLASLLFPVPWDRIKALSRFRLNYDGTFPYPSESPVLGMIAAAGFVFLLIVPIAVMLRQGRVDPDGPLGHTQQHLAALTLVGFLFGTFGGLGTLFALFVSSEIRAWNRIVVYLALFGLAAALLQVQRFLGWAAARASGERDRRLSRRAAVGEESGPRSDQTAGRPGTMIARVVLPAGCLVLVAVGLYDQAAPPGWTSNPTVIEQWRNDATYVAAIEKRVPAGTSIFEIPTLPFPESLPVGDVHDYDPIRPYLHSTDLAWSYGGVKGRPRTDWPQVIEALPTLRLVTALGASGFGGIHLDRFAYPNHDPGKVETDLRALLGAPITSPDKRFEFFDMASFDRQLKQVYSAQQLVSIRRHTVYQPIFYWEPGFTGPPTPDGSGHLVLVGKSAAPSGLIDNPAGPIPMRLTFTVQAAGATKFPVGMDITWPDGIRQHVVVDADGTQVSHSFTAPHGESTLRVEGIGMSSINLVDLVLRDPGLYFPLRGRAEQVGETLAAEKRSGGQAKTPADKAHHGRQHR